MYGESSDENDVQQLDGPENEQYNDEPNQEEPSLFQGEGLEQISSFTPQKDANIDPLGHLSSSPEHDSPQASRMDSISTKDDQDKGLHDAPNMIASLNINIFNFEEKKVDGGKNAVVFYKVQVGFSKKNKKWFIQKRYSEFDALNKILSEIYPNMPILPSKTFFKMSNDQQIEDRMKNLNVYLKQLINRKDMRSSLVFRKFINLEQNFPQSQCFEPQKIANMQEFQKGVRDFIYLPQYESCFVALSDMNILSRVDSYFTNMTMPWEKKKEAKQAKSVLTEEAVATVGALQHFRISEDPGDPKNAWHQAPSWAKTYASQTNVLHWCDEQSILYCGLDSGTIHRYNCNKKKFLIQMNEMDEITVHNTQMRIMGISVDPRVNHLFSISESGYLIVTDLNQKDSRTGCKFINSQCLQGSTGLKAMIHDITRNLLIVASGSGQIIILNSIPSQPEIIKTVETDQKVCIRGLTRSINLNQYWITPQYKPPPLKGGATSNYLMASDINGYITIFDIGNNGKEKLTKRVGNTQGKPKQRLVIWRDKGREIISGDEDGCVTFWYSKDGTALYVLRAHSAAITQMRWNEDLQQLITCSKDKTIKVWKIPPRWIDESSNKQAQIVEAPPEKPKSYATGCEEESVWPSKSPPQKKEPIEEQKQSDQPQVEKVKKVVMAAPIGKQNDDSEDDDLGGWNN